MNRAGWAYGDVSGGGGWLTVLGSAYQPAILHKTRADAESALRASELWTRPHLVMGVALVTEVNYPGVAGWAYEVTPGTLVRFPHDGPGPSQPGPARYKAGDRVVLRRGSLPAVILREVKPGRFGRRYSFRYEIGGSTGTAREVDMRPLGDGS